jgi:hypothetical protein
MVPLNVLFFFLVVVIVPYTAGVQRYDFFSPFSSFSCYVYKDRLFGLYHTVSYL